MRKESLSRFSNSCPSLDKEGQNLQLPIVEEGMCNHNIGQSRSKKALSKFSLTRSTVYIINGL